MQFLHCAVQIYGASTEYLTRVVGIDTRLKPRGGEVSVLQVIGTRRRRVYRRA